MESSLIFGAGVLAHALLLIRKYLRESWIWVVIILTFCFIVFGFGEAALEEKIYGYFIAFCVVFSIFFKDKIMPKINEEMVLLLNITLIASVWTAFVGRELAIALTFLALPTIATIIISFTSQMLKPAWKTFFYIWFLVINVAIILFKVDKNIFSNSNPVEMFFIGMVFI